MSVTGAKTLSCCSPMRFVRVPTMNANVRDVNEY